MAPPKKPQKPKKKPSFDSPAEAKRTADTGWVYRTDAPRKAAKPAAKPGTTKPGTTKAGTTKPGPAKPVATKAARARAAAPAASPGFSRFERVVSLAAAPFEILVHIAMAPLDWKRRR